MPLKVDISGIAHRIFPVRRFVLLIGDAGAMIALLSGDKVQDFQHLGGGVEENIRRAKLAFAEFPKLPVVVLFDVLGQAYRRDRLPPVNQLDRAKILARKLETLFPGTEFKGGLRLGAHSGELRGFEYLFAAVTASPEIAAWQKFLEEIVNPVSDVRLLPVESGKLLQKLADANSSGNPGAWNILISQHRTGGFRQIITRDHRLVIARMTSGFVDIIAPAEIAALLQREISATIDYITRLGFDRTEGLNAVFIGRSDIGAFLANAQLPVRRLTALAPAEAAAVAGVSGAHDDSGHFADLLHAAWGGSRLLPALSVWSPRKRQQRLAALGQAWATRALAAASILGLIYGANLAWRIQGAEAVSIQAEEKRASLQRQYDADLSALDSAPDPIARVRDVLAIHQQLKAADVDFDRLNSALTSALSENVRLRSIAVKINAAKPELAPAQLADGLAVAQHAPPRVNGKISLTLDLSMFRNAEMAVGEANRFAASLRLALPDMRATIVRQPLAILPADTLTVKPGENVLAFSGEERVAEIELTGQLQ